MPHRAPKNIAFLVIEDWFEIRRGKLEHLQRALGIGTDLAVGYSVQIVDPKRDQRARHNRAIAPDVVVHICNS